MNERLRILDADTHVVEPAWLWAKYLDPAFRGRAPRVRKERPGAALAAVDPLLLARLHVACERAGVDADAVIEALERPRYGAPDLELDGQPLVRATGHRAWREGSMDVLLPYLLQTLSEFPATSHLEDFRKFGIERAFLYPSTAITLFSLSGLDPALGRALARAYNDWLRDFCSADPGCLRGVGVVCRSDPQAMVQELERVAAWGWKAVTLRNVPVDGRLPSDPAYEPFWARCEALGMAVGFHEAAHTQAPAGPEERFQTHFARRACAHPLEHMPGLLALIEGGVLERHPDLRVGFLESGCGWVPYWLWRLDTLYAENAQEMKDRLAMKPSDYFRRQCFVTCEAGEPGLEQAIHAAGERCILFGSDYPHPDHPPRVQSDGALLAERLSPRVARRILWDNGCAFYGVSA